MSLSVLVNAIDCLSNVIRKGMLHEKSFRYFLCHIICNFRSNLLETFFFLFSFSPVLPKEDDRKMYTCCSKFKAKISHHLNKMQILYNKQFPFFPHPTSNIFHLVWRLNWRWFNSYSNHFVYLTFKNIHIMFSHSTNIYPIRLSNLETNTSTKW